MHPLTQEQDKHTREIRINDGFLTQSSFPSRSHLRLIKNLLLKAGTVAILFGAKLIQNGHHKTTRLRAAMCLMRPIKIASAMTEECKFTK